MFGLQVAVDDAAAVRVMHGAADPGQHRQLGIDAGVRLRIRPRQQVLPVHAFHRQVGQWARIAVGDADGIQASDGWMLESREQFRLAVEPPPRRRRHAGGAQYLQRDFARRVAFGGQVDATAGAFAQQIQDGVRADPCRHVRHADSPGPGAWLPAWPAPGR
jgi:hypothetical protein